MMGITSQIRFLIIIAFGLPLLLNDEVCLMVRKITRVFLTVILKFFNIIIPKMQIITLGKV